VSCDQSRFPIVYIELELHVIILKTGSQMGVWLGEMSILLVPPWQGITHSPSYLLSKLFKFVNKIIKRKRGRGRGFKTLALLIKWDFTEAMCVSSMMLFGRSKCRQLLLYGYF
jgi:SRSO17 transposase